jgi:hypothetical protein
MTTLSKALTGLTATGLVAGGLVLVPQPDVAHASLACTSTAIAINAGTGAEPKSSAKGHAHVTGSHYVGSISGGYWYWYADNNGGVNGDTWDSFYGSLKCS